MSLEVAPGERVGLVGRSGAGKSTLVNLVLRFYEPETGTIEIDGQDITSVTQESLRQQIAVVTQETMLLHRSVRDNIAHGISDPGERTPADEAAVRAAARRAAADDFIAALRDTEGRQGYDAHVGERGATLSGGQRQRIALARAFYKNAAVCGLSAATRTFNWMPLDHVGGLVMFHVRDVYLGCHQVHARIEWVLEDPLRWLAAISEHRCDTTWAPKSAFGLVVDRAVDIAGRDWDLSRLRYIMNGGEPIRVRTANRFLALLRPYGLPETAMHPGWGMSETSAGVVDCVFPAGLDEATRFIPVGTPHPGVSLRVVDAEDTVVPEGVVGRLQAAGLPITPGYHANPAQNARSFTADGWFRTGDLASITGGVLTVTGRVDDVIEVGGVRCHAHEVEAAVEQLPFVTPTYTIAATAPIDGTEALVIYYHPRSGGGTGEEAWRIVAHVQAALRVAVGRVVPIAKDEVPKTGIGKLRRAALASTS
ncbi:ATP-binding cassette domain-containing protein [Dactylosporangium sp. NPDC051484]|uniref:ATP-binding cassette domain-containing protein n=1 Tax=Dactylosporangium sp. NPDC051484 TaxID=3154942 RepID=UPI00344CF061